MMASERTLITSSGVISGSGLAMAKMMGRGPMEATISLVRAPLADSPSTTSAPTMASARVRCGVSVAWAAFHWSMPWSRPLNTTPSRSTMTVFSAFTPAAFIRAMEDRPAAPAPARTTLTSSSFLPAT